MAREEGLSAAVGVTQNQTSMEALLQQCDRQSEREAVEHTPQRPDAGHALPTQQGAVPLNGSRPREQEETDAARADPGGETRLDPAVAQVRHVFSLAEHSRQEAPARGCTQAPALATADSAVLKQKMAAVLAGGGGGCPPAKRRRFTTKCRECELKSGVSLQWCRYVLQHTGPECLDLGPQQLLAARSESGQPAAAADPSCASAQQGSCGAIDPPAVGIAVSAEPFRSVFALHAWLHALCAWNG